MLKKKFIFMYDRTWHYIAITIYGQEITIFNDAKNVENLQNKLEAFSLEEKDNFQHSHNLKGYKNILISHFVYKDNF